MTAALTPDLRALRGAELEASLDALAALRIQVFRDWPYLYEGSHAYERRYLQSYRDSAQACVIGAFVAGQLIGAATGTPMEDHAEEFSTPFAATGLAMEQIFYCAESVLLPAYRGQGLGHRFFDLREDHARSLGRRYVAFCSVLRPDDHPLRPPEARSNDAFWRKRGYSPLPGVIAHFSWTDLGESGQSDKPLQFWMKAL